MLQHFVLLFCFCFFFNLRYYNALKSNLYFYLYLSPAEWDSGGREIRGTRAREKREGGQESAGLGWLACLTLFLYLYLYLEVFVFVFESYAYVFVLGFFCIWELVGMETTTWTGRWVEDGMGREAGALASS